MVERALGSCHTEIVRVLEARCDHDMNREDKPRDGILRRSFEHWKRMAHAIGVVQTRFLMFGLYALLVVPTGLLMRLFRDPMHLRARDGGNWTPTHREAATLETARRQF